MALLTVGGIVLVVDEHVCNSVRVASYVLIQENKCHSGFALFYYRTVYDDGSFGWVGQLVVG